MSLIAGGGGIDLVKLKCEVILAQNIVGEVSEVEILVVARTGLATIGEAQ